MSRLIGKTCLVTGAAQGIGRAITQAFLAEGANVIATDLRFTDVTEDDRLTRAILDATDEAEIGRAAASYGDVGVLVNCVGYVATGTVLSASMADWDRSMTINARSMALTIRAFLPAMLARRAGSIINIASVVSSLKGVPDRFAYAASKAAVIGLTKSVARDFIEQGVRCNAISPGTIDTPSLHDRFAATGDIDAARRAFIGRQPMGRLGKAEEIAALAVMLASDEASFMTGVNLIADGGWSL